MFQQFTRSRFEARSNRGRFPLRSSSHMQDSSNRKKAQNPAKIGSLQKAMETGLATLPNAFLEHQISKKLKEQMDTPPAGLARQMVHHLLSGNTEPLHAEGVEGDVD